MKHSISSIRLWHVRTCKTFSRMNPCLTMSACFQLHFRPRQSLLAQTCGLPMAQLQTTFATLPEIVSRGWGPLCCVVLRTRDTEMNGWQIIYNIYIYIKAKWPSRTQFSVLWAIGWLWCNFWNEFGLIYKWYWSAVKGKPMDPQLAIELKSLRISIILSLLQGARSVSDVKGASGVDAIDDNCCSQNLGKRELIANYSFFHMK